MIFARHVKLDQTAVSGPKRAIPCIQPIVVLMHGVDRSMHCKFGNFRSYFFSRIELKEICATLKFRD